VALLFVKDKLGQSAGGWLTCLSFTTSTSIVWTSRDSTRHGRKSGQTDASRNPPRSVMRVLSFTTSSVSCVVLFSFLYLVFAILFGIALEKWDVDQVGHCYRDNGISTPGSSHPKVDRIYLGITYFYMFSSLGHCAFSGCSVDHDPSGTEGIHRKLDW
jgi:hypothetical protein